MELSRICEASLRSLHVLLAVGIGCSREPANELPLSGSDGAICTAELTRFAAVLHDLDRTYGGAPVACGEEPDGVTGGVSHEANYRNTMTADGVLDRAKPWLGAGVILRTTPPNPDGQSIDAYREGVIEPAPGGARFHLDRHIGAFRIIAHARSSDRDLVLALRRAVLDIENRLVLRLQPAR